MSPVDDAREPENPGLTVSDVSRLLPASDDLVVLLGRAPVDGGPLERRRRGRVLLREAAVLLWGEGADAVVTARCPRCGGDHGRPAVTDTRSGRHLGGSVTHAGTVTLVALGPAAVGIDAERVAGDPARFDAIRAVTGGTPADGREALRLWTTVEAVLKADGRGLEVDPTRVRIEGPPGVAGATARVDGGPLFQIAGFDLPDVDSSAAHDGLVVSVAWSTSDAR
jgi:4'-phosphopantetheinyl transferase